jgi:hypothetical protein
MLVVKKKMKKRWRMYVLVYANIKKSERMGLWRPKP